MQYSFIEKFNLRGKGRKGRKNLTIKELPQSERPYEKLELYGEKSLSNAELLAIIIKNIFLSNLEKLGLLIILFILLKSPLL